MHINQRKSRAFRNAEQSNIHVMKFQISKNDTSVRFFVYREIPNTVPVIRKSLRSRLNDS